MLNSIAKCMNYYLLAVSIAGILFFVKKKEKWVIAFSFVLFFTILIKSFAKNSSSRYFLSFLVYGIVLTALLTNNFLVSLQPSLQKKYFFFIVFGLIIVNAITITSSFNNAYIFDLLEATENIQKKHSDSKIIIEKKFKRVILDPETIDNKTSKTVLSGPFDDLSIFYFNYKYLLMNYYLVTGKECSSLNKDNNVLQISSAQNAFGEIGHFITNSRKNKFVHVYHLANYNDISDFDINNTTFMKPTHGCLTLSHENISSIDEIVLTKNAFQVTGKQTQIYSKYKIIVADNTFQTSVRIKNIGIQATRIMIGYAVYSKEHIKLDGRSFPYQNFNKVLSVISSEAGSSSIIVDSYPQWQKKCYLALNAKDDLSDIPSIDFPEGLIHEIKELSNGQAEIILDKPLQKALTKGSKVRVHGRSGAFLYTNKKVLQPGEEETFVSTIRKNDSYILYSPKAFSKNVSYVIPLILSYSEDPAENNTVLISDYTVSY